MFKENHHAPPATIAESVSDWFAFAVEEEPEDCPCRGTGWMLHDRDVWAPCYVHATAETRANHPEDYQPEED